MLSTNTKKFLSLFFLVSMPLTAFAHSGKLTGQNIKEILSGASIELDTPFGTTIPISFGNDGIITGQAGRLASYLGSADDRGRWWISNNKLCFKWFKWLNSEPQCLALKLNDHQISWVLDDGMEGTATLQDKPMEIKNYTLKSPPQLAFRPRTPSETHLVSLVKNEKNDIFSLGVHLSRALRSERKSAELKPTYIATSATEKYEAQEKLPTSISKSDRNEDKNLSVDKNWKALPKDEVQRKISSVKYLTVARLENGDTLNIRSGPSLDQSIIGEIPENSISIKFLGSCMNFWCKIQYKNVNGWVNRYYLADTAPQQDPNYN